MKTYKLICMSFDGEYVTDSTHETLEDAENTAADLGSKWFFYPFTFIVSGETVKETCEGLYNMETKTAYMPLMFKNKRLNTVVKAFKKANDFCIKNDLVCDTYEFEDILISQNLKTVPNYQ